MGPKKPAAPVKPVKDIPDDGPQLIVSEDREKFPPNGPPEKVTSLDPSTINPLESFPEWNDDLEQENWGSSSTLFEDPMGFPPLLPHIDTKLPISWKRPSQFLTPLPEPPKSVAPTVKTPAGAPSKKNPPPSAKKVDADVKAEEPKAPRCCYVLYDTTLDPMVEKLDTSHPGFAAPALAERYEWTNDFRRLWSAEQAHDINRWKAEEARIQREKEEKEIALMEYEENCILKLQKAIAAQKQATEAELNDEDLLDDGDDGDADIDFPPPGTSPPPLLFTDIFGSAPVIEIAPNPIEKPTIPEGEYVDPPLASCFRIINRLRDRLVGNQPYYWEAIYPQTVTSTGRRIPIVNPGGKYVVKLFVMGKWRKIIVDDRLPINENNHIVILSSSQPSEIWPSILAKAILKVFTWMQTIETMNNPLTAPQSVGFLLDTIVGWKTRTYCGLSDPKASEELSKIVPPLDEIPPTLQVQPSMTMNTVLLLCPLANIITRTFSTSCGEAFVISSIQPSGTSFAVNIYTIHPNAPMDETMSFTPENIEFHKLTSIILHTIPTHVHQIVEEWSAVVDETNTKTMKRYKNDLPRFLTVHVPEEATSSTVYVTLRSVPLMDSAPLPSDRGVMLVEKQQLSDPCPTTCINSNVDLLKPNVTWPFQVHGAGMHVYRLYTHELHSGYSLELECDDRIQVDSHVECFQGSCKLNVESFETTYNSMASNSWNIVSRFSIELKAPNSNTRNRFYIGIHMYDPYVAPYMHIHLVNNITSQSIRMSLLSGYFELNNNTTIESYTIILECLPIYNIEIPNGKIHIIIASDWFIEKPIIYSPQITSIYRGNYIKNKYLILFRDIYQPEIIENEILLLKTSLKLKTSYLNAGIKLEIIDIKSGNILFKSNNYNNTQIMQLPPYTQTTDGNSGYIIQGSFDETKWIIPEELKSLEPYHGIIGKRMEESIEINKTTNITWELEIIGCVSCKLTPDCTTLNKHAMIRHGWEVVERGRHVRGEISRLLYLGKKEEAMERMVLAEYTIEQQNEMIGRYNIIEKNKIEKINENKKDENILNNYIDIETKKLTIEMEKIKNEMENNIINRQNEYKKRKEELEQIKMEMFDTRNTAIQKRQELWKIREEIRQEQINITPSSIFP